MKIDFLIRIHSFWIGYHYSPRNKRLCINPIPFFTISLTKEGGKRPIKGEY